jgi:predicted PurR-regulated permease PerM
MPKKIEISHRSIIFAVIFLIGLWFLYQIRHIIIALFVSFVFMSVLNPLVDKIEKWHLPRWLAILLVFLIIFGIIGGILAVLIPSLINQSVIFINRISSFFRQFNIGVLEEVGIDKNVIVNQFTNLSVIPSNILKIIIDFFTNLISLLTLIVITFYLMLERKNFGRYLTVLFGEKKGKEFEILIEKIEKRLGGWIRGELSLMVIVGVLSFAGLRLLGIEFALPLAIFAGFLEIVPNIGPIVSAIPAMISGFAISPFMGVAVGALYFLIQQIENNLIVPRVMHKMAGVNPLITILSLAIGFKLAGVLGAILAIPVVLIIYVLASDFFRSESFKNL